MQFNSVRAAGDPNYLNAALASAATLQGTFNPVKQIGTVMNADSSMSQASAIQMGTVGKALNKAREILEVSKYNTDLGDLQAGARQSAQGQAMWSQFGSDVIGTALGSIPMGGGGGASNFMNNPDINYDSIWNGNVIGF